MIQTIYEILLDLWYMVGAPTLPYYINTFLYIMSFLMMIFIILSPFIVAWLLLTTIRSFFRGRRGYRG